MLLSYRWECKYRALSLCVVLFMGKLYFTTLKRVAIIRTNTVFAVNREDTFVR